MTPRILAIANQKGGVGKTTTALSLAACLAETGSRVMVMDLDPHACASMHMGFFPDHARATLYELFLGEEVHARGRLLKSILQKAGAAGFDIAPGHIRLSELEMDLRDRPGKGAIIRQCLDELEENYDNIILDCPPHVGILLVNALVASHMVIIPMQTDFLALHGVRLLFATMKTLNKALPRPLEYRILATMYDRRAGACRRVLQLLRKKAGDKVLESVIPLDTKFREASARGEVIIQTAPASKGAMAYRQLARELIYHEVP